MYDKVGNLDIVSAIKTDHSAITLQLQKIEEGAIAPGFWKMNASVLNDVAYIDEVKKKILIWREEAKEILDKWVIWDWIKYNIRLYSIDYSKRRAKGNREEEERMQKKMRKLILKKNPCVETRKVLEECKMNLERFIRRLKVSLWARGQDGMSMGKKVLSIFKFRKTKPHEKTY